MSKRLKLYNVNLKYIRNLHYVDEHVPSISPQAGKQNRPFLGVVVMVNGSKSVFHFHQILLKRIRTLISCVKILRFARYGIGMEKFWQL